MSAIKYNLTFTGTAEVLFGLLAKLVPSDDLHIHAEEVGDHSSAVVKAMAGFNHALVERRAMEAHVKPKHKFRQYKRRPSKPLDLTAGINKIIMEAMADGFGHHATELAPLLKHGGYSENSVGSRLGKLREHGVVEQMGGGVWRLTKRYVTGDNSESNHAHLP